MYSRIPTAITLVMACGLVAGCASQTPTEEDFGNSVRSMVQGQIYDVDAANFPDKAAVTGGDGTRLENVVEAYRGDVSQPEAVRSSVVIGSGKESR